MIAALSIPGIPDFQFAHPWWLLLLVLLPILLTLRGGRAARPSISFPTVALLRGVASPARAGFGWVWFRPDPVTFLVVLTAGVFLWSARTAAGRASTR